MDYKRIKSRRPVDSKRDISSASCSKCGRRHDLREKETYPAFGKRCHQCQHMGHFAAKCNNTVKQRSVRVVDAESDEEVFTLGGVSTIDGAQIATLRLDSGNYLRFQIYASAQYNVVPMLREGDRRLRDTLRNTGEDIHRGIWGK